MEREGAARPLGVLGCSDAFRMGKLPRGKGKIYLQIFLVPHSAQVLPEDRRFPGTSIPHSGGQARPAGCGRPGGVRGNWQAAASQTLGSWEGSALMPGPQTSTMSSPNSLGGEARGQRGRAPPAWQPHVRRTCWRLARLQHLPQTPGGRGSAPGPDSIPEPLQVATVF